jgi:Flp pilus assembly pilin Flp
MKIRTENKIRMAKHTRLGRIVCRLAGDRTGAVLMEYVILGVMIAAAATLAVIFFGKQIVGSFTTMNNATSGNTKAAEQQATANQQTAQTAQTQSETSRKTVSGGAGNNEANQ